MGSIIRNTKIPLVIQNTLNWKLLKWDINKWKEILGKEKLLFRCGKNKYTHEPQFENCTGSIQMTFDEFLNSKTDSEWYYFDYKYLKDWLLECEEIRKDICWNDLGFSELNVEDSTIWIGSKGAHTPCHVDSYGCNMVAQIYGRKRWLLFPPEEDLDSTRIPYEESSIFSKINFFAPRNGTVKGVKKCYMVILNPGDVLIVPHKWWHYVENLELAISINTWIKLPIDYEERVKEAIVQMTFIQYLKEISFEEKKRLLTTSSEVDMFEETLLNSLSLISNCLTEYNENKLNSSPNDLDITELLKNYPKLKEIQPLSESSFWKLMEHQYNRFKAQPDDDEVIGTEADDLSNVKKFMDSVMHSDVIQLIYNKLTEKL